MFYYFNLIDLSSSLFLSSSTFHFRFPGFVTRRARNGWKESLRRSIDAFSAIPLTDCDVFGRLKTNSEHEDVVFRCSCSTGRRGRKSADSEYCTLGHYETANAAEGFVTCICSKEETQAAPRRADDLGVPASLPPRIPLVLVPGTYALCVSA